jgi:hypothetical protein
MSRNAPKAIFLCAVTFLYALSHCHSRIYQFGKHVGLGVRELPQCTKLYSCCQTIQPKRITFVFYICLLTCSLTSNFPKFTDHYIANYNESVSVQTFRKLLYSRVILYSLFWVVLHPLLLMVIIAVTKSVLPLVELGSSLLYSQESFMDPFPKPDGSSPHSHFLLLQDSLYLYPPSYALFSRVVSCLNIFLLKLFNFLCMACILHAAFFSFSVIWAPS